VAGIQVIIQDEEHTSKCSFLDNESIEHHDEYMGKKNKKGHFQIQGWNTYTCEV